MFVAARRTSLLCFRDSRFQTTGPAVAHYSPSRCWVGRSHPASGKWDAILCESSSSIANSSHLPAGSAKFSA
jgi:hypothetical protein